ncbi:MAG: SGNH/GDSL hydrolase family protein [Pseudomonadota bacterium]|nr:SGNH/GDSL hydrolase family protein [Pseudomonadota bacterium]
MISTWSRRATLALACAGAVGLLSACGSGSVVSDFNPQRFLTVGDGFMDVGQSGYRFTVNDGSNNWVQALAAHYNVTLTAASAGGWGYAQGHARVTAEDTSSGTSAPSVSAQIDTLLARTSFQTNTDLTLVNGGIADIVAAVQATGISEATTTAVREAGTALGQQVRRLVNAGANHVVVTGVYNLGHTPWARGLGQENAVDDLAEAFNTALLLEIENMRDNKVQYFDAAQFFNLVHNNPSSFPVDNVSDPACTTPDATTCTASTVQAGADYNRYLWADSLYIAPAAQRLFVNEDYTANAYSVLRQRW